MNRWDPTGRLAVALFYGLRMGSLAAYIPVLKVAGAIAGVTILAVTSHWAWNEFLASNGIKDTIKDRLKGIDPKKFEECWKTLCTCLAFLGAPSIVPGDAAAKVAICGPALRRCVFDLFDDVPPGFGGPSPL